MSGNLVILMLFVSGILMANHRNLWVKVAGVVLVATAIIAGILFL